MLDRMFNLNYSQKYSKDRSRLLFRLYNFTKKQSSFKKIRIFFKFDRLDAHGLWFQVAA
jgi:hypothetical protein